MGARGMDFLFVAALDDDMAYSKSNAPRFRNCRASRAKRMGGAWEESV